ncbi:MAG: beta-galactosidase [Candidatus Abawacabacteria bacterium]|nr:beta-galactosidase [Candidatus Abawacabacteria bacterium]
MNLFSLKAPGVALLASLIAITPVNAAQFSECSSANSTQLAQQLDQLIAIYPRHTQEVIKDNSSAHLQAHDYRPMRIEERFLYKGDERIQGIMVNVFLHKREASLEQFRQDVAVMKAEGILGVSLEVPWYEYESADNQFTPPVYIEKALDIIEEQGLYSTILLAPHYTPDWVFAKLGDIYMHTPDGRKIIWDNIRQLVPETGAYLTYSPFADAASQEQIVFQTNAVQHYEKRASMIAIFLSNEQTYPKEIRVDYSEHAKLAWVKYLNAIQKPTFALPTDSNDPNYRLFEYFLQDGLAKYQAYILAEVQKQQNTQVPLAHRLMLYESMSDNAHKFHQRPTSKLVNSPILVNDIYGFTPNVFAAQYSYQKPIIIAETNILGNACGEDTLYHYLLFQFLHGASISSVFKWQRGNDYYSLLNLDGSLKDRTKGIVKAARKINALVDLTYPEHAHSYFIDRDQVLNLAKEGKRYQIDSTIEQAWARGIFPQLNWQDENTSDSFALIIANTLYLSGSTLTLLVLLKLFWGLFL